MKYYIHAYNQIIECKEPKDVRAKIIEVYSNTGEYSAVDIVEISNAAYLFACHAGCPGQDRLELNGLIITTE